MSGTKLVRLGRFMAMARVLEQKIETYQELMKTYGEGEIAEFQKTILENRISEIRACLNMLYENIN